ncbi:MAG: rod shape-determining protein MreD [Clostridia bacterium]|nr:rod shape-determining protein MreD [Clostridia bacterium]
MDINFRKVIFVIINILLLLLQVTIFPGFKIGWININLALISVIFTALFTDDALFIVNGFVIGFWFDILAYRYMGYYTLLFMGIALIIKLFSKMVNRYGFITGLVIVFVTTFLTEIITYWTHFVVKGIEYNSFVLTKIIMPQALINTASAVFLFWFYLWLIKKLDLKNRRR